MSDSLDIRAAVVYMCGLTPNPVIELDRLTTVKNSKGHFMPAVRANALSSGGEYVVKFPVFAFDIASEEQFEETRRLFIERINRTFDEYKQNWIKAKESSSLPEGKE